MKCAVSTVLCPGTRADCGTGIRRLGTLSIVSNLQNQFSLLQQQVPALFASLAMPWGRVSKDLWIFARRTLSQWLFWIYSMKNVTREVGDMKPGTRPCIPTNEKERHQMNTSTCNPCRTTKLPPRQRMNSRKQMQLCPPSPSCIPPHTAVPICHKHTNKTGPTEVLQLNTGKFLKELKDAAYVTHLIQLTWLTWYRLGQWKEHQSVYLLINSSVQLPHSWNIHVFLHGEQPSIRQFGIWLKDGWFRYAYPTSW